MNQQVLAASLNLHFEYLGNLLESLDDVGQKSLVQLDADQCLHRHPDVGEVDDRPEPDEHTGFLESMDPLLNGIATDAEFRR